MKLKSLIPFIFVFFIGVKLFGQNIYSNTIRGDIVIVGNTLLQKEGENNLSFVNSDNQALNSSFVNIEIPASSKITKGYLYLASSTKVDKKIHFKTPAHDFYGMFEMDEQIKVSDNLFIQKKDITVFIEEFIDGEYALANISMKIEKNSFLAWCLVIVYEDGESSLKKITWHENLTADSAKSDKNMKGTGAFFGASSKGFDLKETDINNSKAIIFVSKNEIIQNELVEESTTKVVEEKTNQKSEKKYNLGYFVGFFESKHRLVLSGIDYGESKNMDFKLGTINSKSRVFLQYGKLFDYHNKTYSSTKINYDYLIQASSRFTPYIGAHIGYDKANIDGYKDKSKSIGFNLGLIYTFLQNHQLELGYQYSKTNMNISVYGKLNTVTTPFIGYNYKF